MAHIDIVNNKRKYCFCHQKLKKLDDITKSNLYCLILSLYQSVKYSCEKATNKKCT